eukprot:TRINITY_DN12103_c0_g1_i2.p1 TRINITY_DN12103_c0_g1~~TRINITY_DN12103_c0_g1_i2.p1  ORF type:complete len:425 (-),score=67.16 TRINITY_DN12103_c0_g1_i2:103-1377(-)
MKRITLPEPPSGLIGMPEIFEGGASTVVRRALIIGNGAPGAENQCIGLIRALGLAHRHSLYRVTRPRGGYNEWLRWLPVSLHKRLDYLIRHVFTKFPVLKQFQSKMLAPSCWLRPTAVDSIAVPEADARQISLMANETSEKEGPLLVVASGHDTIKVAATVRRLARKNTFVVQIQHPRYSLDRFNLVVCPHHDFYALTPAGREQIPRFLWNWITPREPPDRHVVLTVGALHQADFATLREAATQWQDEMAPLPKPLLVVNIGAPARYCKYGSDFALKLIDALKQVLDKCGSVRISFSRRTTPQICSLIRKEFGTHPKVYIWDGQGPNPHLGHLAWADAFVITADSISMVSEACSTGKPVYVSGAERCRWKFAAFYNTLRHRGVFRDFTGKEDISESWGYPPLNDNAEAASRVREALAEEGWSIR